MDVLPSHNWIHDDSIRLINHKPKLIYKITIIQVYIMWHTINAIKQFMQQLFMNASKIKEFRE